VKLVPDGLADLWPMGLVIQMTLLAHAPIEVGVRRDIRHFGEGPVPNDADAILNILLVANVTVDFLVRSLSSRFATPQPSNDMTRKSQGHAQCSHRYETPQWRLPTQPGSQRSSQQGENEPQIFSGIKRL
jgi:hypothetical protein